MLQESGRSDRVFLIPVSTMTIASLIQHAIIPSIEAELLLAFALNRNRTWIVAHAADELSQADHERCIGLIQRRKSGEPLAYITGTKEFFGRAFCVNPDVLIPRPATEILVMKTCEYLRHPMDSDVEADTGITILSRCLRPEHMPTTIVDIGTGSGIIAVTLALEIAEIPIIATDIQTAALETAQHNAETHSVAERIDFRLGSLLEPIADLSLPFLIVSNPPYIPSKRLLSSDVKDFEPHVALFAGSKGMDVLDPLFRAALAHPFCAGIIVECESSQIRSLDRLLTAKNS